MFARKCVGIVSGRSRLGDRKYSTPMELVRRGRAFLRNHEINLTLRDVPEPAKYLGFAGTLPFLATTYALAAEDLPAHYWAVVQNAQLTYSASILSFMGAVHWGLQMSNYGVASSGLAWQRYTLSTVPALVAWGSLCMPIPAAYITQITAFSALLAGDVHAHSRRLVPMWYPGLRVYLTSIVTASLLVSFVSDSWRGFHAKSDAKHTSTSNNADE